jgi:succinyl-CoA synthetase beta subunit
MPKLYEYQGKMLLKKQGVAIPDGSLASTPKEAKAVAERLSKPVMLKAQVGVTGRFKAGGIKSATNPAEAEKAAAELLGKDIKGIRVEKILVEEQLDIKREFYVGVIVNDSCHVKSPVLMFSTQGGVDIEDVAVRHPEKVVSLEIDIVDGMSITRVKNMLTKVDAPAELASPLSNAIYGLWGVFQKYGARSVEINPLVLTSGGKVYPADCRITIDEASVFRYPELEIKYPRDLGREPTELEQLAWRVEEGDYRGVGYFAQMVKDFGPREMVVGFHGIGGGGAMLGADALMRHGIKLADYADTSGNPTAAKVYRIIKLIMSQPNIDGYILMGPVVANQEQWHHAYALVRALREELPHRPAFPVVILIAGNKEMESMEILRNGLARLPNPIEIYGRDYVSRVDYVAERMRQLVEAYNQSSEGRNR